MVDEIKPIAAGFYCEIKALIPTKDTREINSVNWSRVQIPPSPFFSEFLIMEQSKRII